MSRKISSNSPFYQFVDSVLEEWSQRKFYGIKTDQEALAKIVEQLRLVKDQHKVLDKKLITLSSIIFSNAFGVDAYLSKVEEEVLNTCALLLEVATILRKWRNRFKTKN